MTKARATATIFYHPDAYGAVETATDINGRRMAGDSFLDGFLRHASAPVIHSVTRGRTADPMPAMVKARAGKRGVGVKPQQMKDLGAAAIVQLPGPGLADWAWARQKFSPDAYSICGLTHTTAVVGIDEPWFGLHAAPTEPWDALICTSRAVQASIHHKLDLVDEYFRRRLGAVGVPRRVSTPILPLGLTAADFAMTAADRVEARAAMGIGPEEIVVMSLARLTPSQKFDPLPLYQALERASSAAPLRLVLAGYFSSTYDEDVFRKGAAALCPSVGVDFASAGDHAARRRAYAAADIFVFPIDNVQETFGLAPIEAMAAGLPVIVTDWDGMKDTVPPEVGFRVPTRTTRGDDENWEIYLRFTKFDAQREFLGLISAQTSFDVGAMAARIADLATNPDLRARMGAAGLRRAHEVYDWSALIPRYEELWAELNAIRFAATAEDRARYHGVSSPILTPPMEFFAEYPTEQGLAADLRLAARPGADAAKIAEICDLRGYQVVKRAPVAEEDARRMLGALQAAGPATAAALAQRTGFDAAQTEKLLIWLMKYDLVEEASADQKDPAATPEGEKMAHRLTATLLYSADAYDNVSKQENINGRRMAGNSFMRGFLRHACAPAIHCLRLGGDLSGAVKMIEETSDKRAVAVKPHEIGAAGDPKVIYRADPEFAHLAWLRYSMGQDAFSICGVTHTTNGFRLPNPFLNLRQSPVESWDGLICTARTVKESLDVQFDMIDDYFARRFGPAPPRPQMPVIPLGVNNDELEVTEAQRAATRAEIGAAPEDIVVLSLSRLSPHYKYDPLPLFMALEEMAQRQAKKIHLLLAGYHLGPYSGWVFRNGAESLCPSVKVSLRKVDNAEERCEALAAGDIFVFPIDNLQETFGIAPIEAMSAGLPVIASDWNGMKDTVSDDVGFRIPTRTASPHQSDHEAFLELSGADDIIKHATLMTGMTEMDVGVLADRLTLLAQNEDLRKTLGAAGRRRAREVYDWGVIVPQYEEFWAELDARRRAAGTEEAGRYHGMHSPVAPPPFRQFACYPTSQGLAGLTFRPGPKANAERLREVLRVRNYDKIERWPVTEADAGAMLAAVSAAAAPDLDALVAATGFDADQAERLVIWLMKYDLVRSQETNAG